MLQPNNLDGLWCLFVDIFVLKTNDTLSFKVYHKPASNKIFSNFFSNHHRTIKSSVISLIFLNAFKISCPQHLKEENNFMWKYFVN